MSVQASIANQYIGESWPSRSDMAPFANARRWETCRTRCAMMGGGGVRQRFMVLPSLRMDTTFADTMPCAQTASACASKLYEPGMAVQMPGMRV